MPKCSPRPETPQEFEVVDRETAYQGYFRIERYRVRYRQYSGDWCDPVWREVFERGHAAVVLPYAPDRDELVLLEQFRVGAMEADGGAWMLEPVAGIIEPGETSDEVARRETKEEAGLDVMDLMPALNYLASPGGTTESVSVFIGRVDSRRAGGTFGLDSESEDILSFALPFNDAMDMIMARPTKVASLVIAAQWLALNRARVRRAWAGPEETPSDGGVA